jgi:WhiB family transcriptional regulator, redox-sensing transcriptional regulator
MPFQGTRVPVTKESAQVDWRSRGACGDHESDLFFPAEDAPVELVRVQEATAKAVCRSCPVAGMCLSVALSERLLHGVWGGLSGEDRRAVLAARAAVSVPAVAVRRARSVRTRRRYLRTNSVVRHRPVAVQEQPAVVAS